MGCNFSPNFLGLLAPKLLKDFKPNSEEEKIGGFFSNLEEKEEKMSSKHPPAIRVRGQKSILSTFLSRSSNQKPSKEDVKIKTSNKDSCVSLSDFLNRKLHKSSVLPNSVQGKERPFFSPVGSGEVSGSSKGPIGVKKREEDKAEVKSVVDVVFEQFKCTTKEKEDALGVGSSNNGEFGCSNTDDMQKARKRKSPFGGEGEQSSRKNLFVLGEGHRKPTHPIHKQKGAEQSFVASKKPRHQFNHYANGNGWWDCNMEGVDNEEVGCREVWEGIGSATLGGLDWN